MMTSELYEIRYAPEYSLLSTLPFWDVWIGTFKLQSLKSEAAAKEWAEGLLKEIDRLKTERFLAIPGVSWSGRKPKGGQLLPEIKGKTLAEIVSEDREP